MTETIGYVGVGLMGGPMARWLLASGYALRAFDVSPERMQEAVAAGATAAASAGDVVEGADIVVLNLPTPAAVEEAVFGQDGIAGRIRPPCLLVDFSTIEVDRCRSFAQRLKDETGCSWIDAPVSGGPVASTDGTLTVMAGGDPADIARLRPFFDTVSANFTHVGPTGDGLVAKMVSQLIVGCLHVVLAEGARLAELSGIDAAAIPACVAGGHADGVLLRQLYPRIVERDFRPRAYVRQIVKDLHMVEELAESTGTPTPMLGTAYELYRGLATSGSSELDSSAIVKMYETARSTQATSTAGHEGAN
ncbi:MAG: NAD(P)-dependent oxidoreductase [Bauldia sp.]|nr:NAD(P)-dependent oxidoreductase [Bauldia sp.]